MTSATVADTPTPEAKGELPPRWRGPVMPVNRPAADGRTMSLAVEAEVPARPLPLPLSAQESLADGHDGSVVVGLIERFWLEGDMVHAEGSFDLGNPVAAEWSRRLGAGSAGWVSSDLSGSNGVLAVEEVFVDLNGIELSEAAASANPAGVGGTQRRYTGWKMMGVTLVSSPAFEDARIEPVWEGAAADPALVAAAGPPVADDDETAVPAAPSEDDHADDGMIALLPTIPDAERLAIGSEPANELHLTLAYLDDITGLDAATIAAHLEEMGVIPPAPIEGKVFGHAVFNPADKPANVFLVEADGLADLAMNIGTALLVGESPVEVSKSHDGFIPHITYAYGQDRPDEDAEPTTGPVRFDTLRIAIGGQHHDISLAPVQAGLVAAGVVYKVADFEDPQLTEPTSITVKNGRVYGHLAYWNVCHTGFKDLCITAPCSSEDYHYFHQGQVATDGGMLPVGKITLGTGHPSLDMTPRAALEQYDNSGTAVAVVRAGEDDYGIWLSGRILPGVSEERLAELQRSPLSGDWRPMVPGGPYEMIAALAVNVPGFPKPRARALSGRGVIAAGALDPGRGHHPELDQLTTRINEIMAKQLEPIMSRLTPDPGLADRARAARSRVLFGDRAATVRARMRAHRAEELRARVAVPATNEKGITG